MNALRSNLEGFIIWKIPHHEDEGSCFNGLSSYFYGLVVVVGAIVTVPSATTLTVTLARMLSLNRSFTTYEPIFASALVPVQPVFCSMLTVSDAEPSVLILAFPVFCSVRTAAEHSAYAALAFAWFVALLAFVSCDVTIGIKIATRTPLRDVFVTCSALLRASEYSGLKRPGYRGSGTIVPQQ